MRQLNIFFNKKCLHAKTTSNIEGNFDRSASYLISVVAKYCSD